MSKSLERAVLEKIFKMQKNAFSQFSENAKMQLCALFLHLSCIMQEKCKFQNFVLESQTQVPKYEQNANNIQDKCNIGILLAFVLHFFAFLLHNARKMQKHNLRPETSSPRRSLPNPIKKQLIWSCSSHVAGRFSVHLKCRILCKYV